MAPTSQSPLVSVVIPHRGEDKALEKCVRALRSQNYPRQDTEILIVLNEESKRPLSFPLEPGRACLVCFLKALLFSLEKRGQTLTVRINRNHESPLILFWVSPGFFYS